ncbi:DEAD/DEAH box helicase family protein [Candidatus Saccharibacteria bacterium]|nr:DEAD/DEAH box helicase family protein [Candidatus Saccharibacteria bacterium]
MILKPYQKQIIDDLARYLDILHEQRNTANAFAEFWIKHPRTPVTPILGDAVEPYKNNVPGCPHVCIKVPTAGGKTFIAANALSTIFNALSPSRPKVVVWLVPSNSILEQTIRNFSNPYHPYRQQLNTDFANKVDVFDKKALLQGAGFNNTSVRENMTLCILSFDSLRAKKKEDRKVNDENGNLQSFANDVNEDEISLMAVLRAFNPVVIVDESHNAESDLSVEMLKNLNPSFILDLTATPRKNSNIISFTPAIELKKESMVKLPVIVYNHHKKEEVVSSALELRGKLERSAEYARKNGAPYIRPIVLFQAEPKNKDDNVTFERVKSMLLELKIPEEQIKIKTADKNELLNVDLLSPDCPVRYIITVNALKEGWDCPFAYILASLADRSSAVDVEQILGRVLRLPNVRKNENVMLNMSYVFTASAKFSETLDSIVNGLNRAGFSSKDYRQVECENVVESAATSETQANPVPPLGNSQEDVFDVSQIFWNADSEIADEPAVSSESQKDSGAEASSTNSKTLSPNAPVLAQIEQIAKKENEALEKKVAEHRSTPTPPSEMERQVKIYKVKEVFKESAESVKLPQFFMNCIAEDSHADLFGIQETPFEKDLLLKNFPLRNADTNIDFQNIEIDMRKIDLDESQKDYTPTIFKVDASRQQEIVRWLLNIDNIEKKRQKCAKLLRDWIGSMYPIPERDVVEYITRVLGNFNDSELDQMLNSQSEYATKIKEKINDLSAKYIEMEFDKALDQDKIVLRPSFNITKELTLSKTCKPLPKMLHEKEDDVNDFEESVINAIANLENVEFWTRNREKKDFCINGFINHYPDFIIKTKRGKIVLLETKGDHLDAEKKIKLGNLWAAKAGNEYRYCLVYEHRKVEHAYTKDEFIATLKEW